MNETQKQALIDLVNQMIAEAVAAVPVGDIPAQIAAAVAAERGRLLQGLKEALAKEQGLLQADIDLLFV